MSIHNNCCTTFQFGKLLSDLSPIRKWWSSMLYVTSPVHMHVCTSHVCISHVCTSHVCTSHVHVLVMHVLVIHFNIDQLYNCRMCVMFLSYEYKYTL